MRQTITFWIFLFYFCFDLTAAGNSGSKLLLSTRNGTLIYSTEKNQSWSEFPIPIKDINKADLDRKQNILYLRTGENLENLKYFYLELTRNQTFRSLDSERRLVRFLDGVGEYCVDDGEFYGISDKYQLLSYNIKTSVTAMISNKIYGKKPRHFQFIDEDEGKKLSWIAVYVNRDFWFQYLFNQSRILDYPFSLEHVVDFYQIYKNVIFYEEKNLKSGRVTYHKHYIVFDFSFDGVILSRNLPRQLMSGHLTDSTFYYTFERDITQILQSKLETWQIEYVPCLNCDDLWVLQVDEKLIEKLEGEKTNGKDKTTFDSSDKENGYLWTTIIITLSSVVVFAVLVVVPSCLLVRLQCFKKEPEHIYNKTDRVNDNLEDEHIYNDDFNNVYNEIPISISFITDHCKDDTENLHIYNDDFNNIYNEIPLHSQ